MSQDRITIVEPTGVRRSIPLPPQGLTIGRGPDNQLIVDHEFISRNHAQISVDGKQCYVTDLNSSNGTYLGHTRLAPDAPTLWSPGTPLHVGDVLIHLEREGRRKPDTKELQRRQHERTDVAGWAPETTTPGVQTRSSFLVWLGVGIAVMLLLGLCAVVGVGAYYYLAL